MLDLTGRLMANWQNEMNAYENNVNRSPAPSMVKKLRRTKNT